MTFEDALKTVFEERAGELSPEHRRLLKALWAQGVQAGKESRAGDFEQGRKAGLQELGVLFSKVLSKKPVGEVFHHTKPFQFKPWVEIVLQAVMDASDLEEAARVADHLSSFGIDSMPADAVVRALQWMPDRWGDTAEVAVLQTLWGEEELDEMLEAQKLLQERDKRRR